MYDTPQLAKDYTQVHWICLAATGTKDLPSARLFTDRRQAKPLLLRVKDDFLRPNHLGNVLDSITTLADRQHAEGKGFARAPVRHLHQSAMVDLDLSVLSA